MKIIFNTKEPNRKDQEYCPYCRSEADIDDFGKYNY